jgi:BTB/POZ domain
MSTVPHEAISPTDDSEPLANLLFDYPGADVILRSQDAFHFRVPKTYIANSSPILGELTRKTLDFSDLDDANPEALLVVQLPENGKILHCLLTFVFLVTPILPPSHEETMELLSIAQKYQMDSVLTHIRDRIARHHPLPTHLEPALRIYFLAQKYGLRPEALQTARTILNYPMSIEDFDNKLDIMSGASLYELWKYHERVQDVLASDLTEFKVSRANGTIAGLRCTDLNSSQIPRWLGHYIMSIEKSPSLFDLVEFNASMSRHIVNKGKDLECECASIPSQTIRRFWDALASVVDGSFEKASVVDVLSCLKC